MKIPREGISISEFVSEAARRLAVHPGASLTRSQAVAIAEDVAGVTDADRSRRITPREAKRLSAPTLTRRRVNLILSTQHRGAAGDVEQLVRCLDLPKGVLGPLLSSLPALAYRGAAFAALFGAGALVQAVRFW